MRIYTVDNGQGHQEQLEPGTTKAEAQLVLDALGEGWKLTSTGTDDRLTRAPRTAYRKTKHARGHGYWPTTSAVPREESLQRVLTTERRVRMNDDPVVTMHLDPTDRPMPVAKTDHGSRCYCTDCLTDK